jgi:alkanesulfonate monooxygenase SsuD/methylene tetrahydromethanopterin reductase-like flavin-dependent oxidoreductase (luciferase family)
MRHALYVAPFSELADPLAMVEVAVAAERSGWDGVFLWDHIWRPPDRTAAVGDAWITLAAIATETSRLRIGPMVVPLARRRPQKVARESVALDHLAEGRLTLGVGLGVNTDGELERFGEVTDDKERGNVLDEAIELLCELWSGDEVRHSGRYFRADGVRFLPRPIQSPRIPLWGAARGGSGSAPLRRAARLDGFFPVGSTKVQLQRMLEFIVQERGSLEGYDVAVIVPENEGVDGLAELGVTWLLRALPDDVARQRALEIAATGPC